MGSPLDIKNRERSKTVAWLREQADILKARANASSSLGEYRQLNQQSLNAARFADQIEAGEHDPS